MATIKRFEDLEMWGEARKLSLEIYKITLDGEFKSDLRFRSQIRAAAGSVMDNIAEGFERSGRLEFVNFLGMAKGSAGEVRSQLYRALDQEYIDEAQFAPIHAGFEKLGANLSGFIAYLNKSEIKGQKFKGRS